MLIVNADDVGRCKAETDSAFSLHQEGRITSGTFMMFMQDSERAAQLALEHNFPAGLHLNLSQTYTLKDRADAASSAHERIVRFMTSSKYAVLLYHPGLRRDFRDVYESQADEFERLFGRRPVHIDGHQHRHLCANVLLDNVIPSGVRIRRSFSFFRGDKSWLNRLYRRWVDSRLRQRYKLADHFFSLAKCLKDATVNLTLELAQHKNVELMTHPVHAHESDYLRSPAFDAIRSRSKLGTYEMI